MYVYICIYVLIILYAYILLLFIILVLLDPNIYTQYNFVLSGIC